jgi:hypothetical protein
MLNRFKTMQKIDWATLAAQALFSVLYLAIFYRNFSDVYSLGNLNDNYAWPSFFGYYFVKTVVIVAAYMLMSSRLGEVRNQKIVKFWLAMALVLSIISEVLYVWLYALAIPFTLMPLGLTDWMVPIATFMSFLGAIMPFILLTYWLKYRLRADEF